jgi:hypothetical protein
MSGTPHFLENRLTNRDEVVSLTRRLSFTPQKHFWWLFTLVAVNTTAIVRLEGLGKAKQKFGNLMRNRTRIISAGSTMTQPTIISRPFRKTCILLKLIFMLCTRPA